MTKETAISICETLYHYLQPFDEQPKEAFRMAVDALEGQLEQSQGIVRCKDCKHKGDSYECILDRDLEEHGSHRTEEYDDWFCADGQR